jgi:hypothetical protein
LLFRVTQETGQAISLFRRTSFALIGVGADDLTFARLQFIDHRFTLKRK